ncbi:MAG: TraB/GumN family protein [Treponema sp.]|jgi:pheromone shutdown protein TraB|nr:TraB/GumN family protein [Treponema sp.]
MNKQDHVKTITLDGKRITLIGTAHVSRESIEEVRDMIREQKPGMVCVELDKGRYGSIVQKENWEKLDVAKVFKEGKGFLLVANLVLSSFQRRLGSELGVKPGEEMKIAVETAEAQAIPCRLCDREVQTTLRRAWARCGLWGKCKLLASLLSSAFTTEKLSEEEIENLKKASELDGMMTDLADYLPGVKTTLIDERDRYLAAKIWTAAQEPPPPSPPASIPVPPASIPVPPASIPVPPASVPPPPAADPRHIVAVVGAGHLSGIAAHLERIAAGEESPEVDDLDRVPPPSLLSRAVGWIIPLAIAALIISGFFKAGAALSIDMLLRWVLWNGSLAALGSLIALAHPLSILISFLGAPVATINPFIGVGLFAGITEAGLRRPRVSDTETISEDVSSIRGIYRNRITRALLVFFLSSLGGAIGNFISIPSLAGILVK